MTAVTQFIIVVLHVTTENLQYTIGLAICWQNLGVLISSLCACSTFLEKGREIFGTSGPHRVLFSGGSGHFGVVTIWYSMVWVNVYDSCHSVLPENDLFCLLAIFQDCGP